ncbi:MAG TPA: RagB/SusD family nutrient uptake outer membrane protein [Vicinamibacterales bacterium]|nr:RagB/SusD family nutrient uptake outer membrane protein [Vicinamibacterales bacterium]
MTSYGLSRAARLTAAALTGFVLSACSTDELLTVTDPDIINPSDVNSPAGANAVRLGALARLNAATTGAPAGGEGLIQLGGLLADEWRSGDTFIDRDEIDQRNTRRENTFLLGATRQINRARLSGSQASELLDQYAPAAPGWHRAEMYFVQAYAENLMAEHFCNGLIMSTVVNGVEQYGAPMTNQAAYERALAHADSGLALITGTTTDDNRVRSALQVIKGRILVNLDRHAEAATAVAPVLTSARYNMFHSQTSNENAIWNLNNSLRRYNLSGGEGGVGLDFVTPADPRVPNCAGGTAPCNAAGATGTRTFDNNTTPAFRAQLMWTTRDATVYIASGIEARLIEAEAQVRANPTTGGTYLAILNNLRSSGGVAGLTPLVDPGTNAGRIDQVFRERAFWLFGKGHRLGDLRRLMRQYGRTETQVFPNGTYHKGGNYGTGVNFPVPQAEDNNPLAAGGCIDRLP